MTWEELQRQSPANFSYDLRDQLKRHIYGRSEQAFAAGDAIRDTLVSRPALRRHQTTIRKRFIEALGGLPAKETPLSARITGQVQCEGFRIEKVIFQSRPRVYVTANLYLPEGITRPRGAVLFLCGHAEQAKHSPSYQIVCQHLVRAGLVVLAQDPVGQGERLSYYEPAHQTTTVRWGTGEHQYVGTQCELLGESPARHFLHDAMRGVDYLISRPEVDARKIGVTGSSGGGTQTCLMMVCDPRIAAAAPATFLMNRRSYMDVGGAQDEEQIWPGVSAWGFDHEDVLLAMCPRPVCVLAVTYDFFPIEGTRRTVERCRRFWDMCRRPADLQLFEDVSVHAYTPAMATKAAEFFSEHLLGRKVTPNAQTIAALEPSRLWCTRSGQVRGELAGAKFIFEENQDRLQELERTRRRLSKTQRRKQAVQWLRRQVFKDRRPVDLNPRLYLTEQMQDLRVELAYWWSQEGIFNHGILLRPLNRFKEKLPVTLAVWDDGIRALQNHSSWISDTCRRGRAVLVLETSGVGAIAPHPLNNYPPQGHYGVIQKLHHDLVWLDDSLAALRTYDVLRALDMVTVWPGLTARGLELYAHGRHSLYGRLAAVLDARITRLSVEGGLSSYADLCRSRHYDPYDIMSLILPGVLQHWDLPDLKA